jgi:hypothetical protein
VSQFRRLEVVEINSPVQAVMPSACGAFTSGCRWRRSRTVARSDFSAASARVAIQQPSRPIEKEKRGERDTASFGRRSRLAPSIIASRRLFITRVLAGADDYALPVSHDQIPAAQTARSTLAIAIRKRLEFTPASRAG